MSPHCVWLVIVGGCTKLEWRDDGGGVEEPVNIFIEDTNRLIMIIELGKSYCNTCTFNHFAHESLFLLMHLHLISAS